MRGNSIFYPFFRTHFDLAELIFFILSTLNYISDWIAWHLIHNDWQPILILIHFGRFPITWLFKVHQGFRDNEPCLSCVTNQLSLYGQNTPILTKYGKVFLAFPNKFSIMVENDKNNTWDNSADKVSFVHYADEKKKNFCLKRKT